MAECSPGEDSSARHKEVVRAHYVDLCEAIGESPTVLMSVSARFFQHKFIDKSMKVSIQEAGGLKGANMLLDQVQLKLKQSEELYLPQVLAILKEVTALTEIVAKMEDYLRSIFFSDKEMNPTLRSTTDLECKEVWKRQMILDSKEETNKLCDLELESNHQVAQHSGLQSLRSSETGSSFNTDHFRESSDPSSSESSIQKENKKERQENIFDFSDEKILGSSTPATGCQIHLSSQRSSKTSSIKSKSHFSVEAPEDLIEDVIRLSGDYDLILTGMQCDIEQKIATKEIELNHIARYVSQCLRRRHVPLKPDENSLDDIFYPLTQEFSFVDPNLDLLCKLDKTYCCSTCYKDLRKYFIDLKKFKESTTILDFIQLLKEKRVSLRKAKKKKYHDAEIIIRVCDLYGTRTVDDVLKLKEKIFCGLDIGLVSVHQSILTLVYSIHKDLIIVANTMVEESDKQLLEELGVVSIQVADTPPLVIVEVDEMSSSDIVDHFHKSSDKNYGMSSNLKDLPAEGMLSLKPDWDEQPFMSSISIRHNKNESTSASEGDVSSLNKSPTLQPPVNDFAEKLMTLEFDAQDQDKVPSPPLRHVSRANSQASSAGSHHSHHSIMHMASGVYKFQESIQSSQTENNEQLCSAAGVGDVEEVSWLLSIGTDVNCIDGIEEYTPLHLAARAGHSEIVLTLLFEGALVDSKDIEEYTPLHLAARAGHAEIVQLLLSKGASLDSKDWREYTPLHLAAEAEHTEIVQLLLHKGAPVDSMSRNEYTPLHSAARAGHTKIVQLLLFKGATVDSKSRWMETPLYLAAKEGHTEVVKLLLSKGASLNSKNNREYTPLHLAAEAGHIKIVQLLLSKRVSVCVKNKHGQTPLDVAIKYGRTEIVQLLKTSEKFVRV